MEGEEQQSKSRVLKIDSARAWDFYVNQASNEGCPMPTFDQKLKSGMKILSGSISIFSFKKKSVVVHFSASWCIPSVAMNPIFQELASSFPDVLFLTVDVDDVKDVASRMEIKAMPSFLLMKDGAPVDKLVGANPDEIRKRIDSLVRSTRTQIA